MDGLVLVPLLTVACDSCLLRRCPLWSSNDELHVAAVAKVAEEAKREALARDPTATLKHDPTAILPKATGSAARPRPAHEVYLQRARDALQFDPAVPARPVGRQETPEERRLRKQARAQALLRHLQDQLHQQQEELLARRAARRAAPAAAAAAPPAAVRPAPAAAAARPPPAAAAGAPPAAAVRPPPAAAAGAPPAVVRPATFTVAGAAPVNGPAVNGAPVNVPPPPWYQQPVFPQNDYMHWPYQGPRPQQDWVNNVLPQYFQPPYQR
ncbi:Translation initiation factor IF-2 [Frankliniella fusca]|uniref:Translation initiation factor IF-2 n=1 Tax=Frankliniella fusca TaxID=407009 RepID=A0AAE1LB52_9NEOP|nr:Translation initiation factor IF-2 [Frankliniella fusca]